MPWGGRSSALGEAVAKPRDNHQKDLLRPGSEDIIDIASRRQKRKSIDLVRVCERDNAGENHIDRAGVSKATVVKGQDKEPLVQGPAVMLPWLRSACAILLLIPVYARPASSSVPEGTWLFADRVALQIFECSGLLCGKIVWLLQPDTPGERPDVDYHNPNPALRQRRLCGLTIIWGLRPDGLDHWSDGRLYDPKDGVTYDVTAQLIDPNRIFARVYLGTPVLGRTEILVRDPPRSFYGRC